MLSVPSKAAHASQSPVTSRFLDLIRMILNQDGCTMADHEQNIVSEAETTALSLNNLQQFTEEYTIQPSPTHVPQTPKGFSESYRSESHAIDLSTCAQVTPAPYGEVPGFVLAKVEGQHVTPSSKTSSLKLLRSSARVCLENRFQNMLADSQENDAEAGFINNFMSMIQTCTGAPEAEVKSQNTDSIVKDQRCSSLHPKRPVLRDKTSKKLTVNKDKVHLGASSQTKTVGTGSTMNLMKQRHNYRERERRKLIRSYCDELNLLVPFCNSDTDKVTTLSWTTAFLKYLRETHGDTLKEEFRRVFESVTDPVSKSNSEGPVSVPSLTAEQSTLIDSFDNFH